MVPKDPNHHHLISELIMEHNMFTGWASLWFLDTTETKKWKDLKQLSSSFQKGHQGIWKKCMTFSTAMWNKHFFHCGEPVKIFGKCMFKNLDFFYFIRNNLFLSWNLKPSSDSSAHETISKSLPCISALSDRDGASWQRLNLRTSQSLFQIIM